MRLILAYRAVAYVRFAMALLHISLALGWLGESLWHAARAQMDEAAALADRAHLPRS
ncbi:hypothetical protein BGCPKDLD_3861 [Methylorubrum suomiense]|uniref:Uncharacterized protein n=1 Tax=Methylorubrum suomiense TaxID=144191 RepID=A0ABQ4V0N1_9HYPH|nr:hypothetical protein BGCPKDLD_3861 [Methylorubrum suomiense]